jgi:hypothetical protein
MLPKEIAWTAKDPKNAKVMQQDRNDSLTHRKGALVLDQTLGALCGSSRESLLAASESSEKRAVH